MDVRESTVWDRDPHTEAKHLVLRGYFDAWYPAMLRTFPRLTVLEGYSGPGVYAKGEDGSPEIALRSLAERPELLDNGRAVRFVFIEERRDRFEKLQDVIDREFPTLPKGVQVEFHHESCEHRHKCRVGNAHNTDGYSPPLSFRLRTAPTRAKWPIG